MLHDTLCTGNMPLTYEMNSIILVYTEYLLVYCWRYKEWLHYT